MIHVEKRETEERGNRPSPIHSGVSTAAVLSSTVVTLVLAVDVYYLE